MRNLTWRWWLALMGAGAGAMLACPANADDTFPPCWRGRPDTTYQQWTFGTSANPAAPEFVTNPFGSPLAAVTVGTAGAGWIDQQPIIFGNTRAGVWDLGRSGNISFSIPNATAPAGSWKFIYLQVTQYRDSLYSQLANVSIPGATLVRSQLKTNEVLLPPTFPFNGRWVVEQSVWLMEPCPVSETVIISSGPANSVAIDQVVIDTRCATRDEGDISPPCWRGRPGSTYQNWSYHRPGNPSAPEDALSPGSPSASITLGALALGWQDVLVGFGCRQGYWDLGRGGQMSLDVPNVPGSPTSYKNIQVQVVEFQDSLAYNQLAAVSIAGATMLSEGQTTVEVTLTGNWVVHRSVWRIAPCPVGETVLITAPLGSALIDQVVVDTLCVDLGSACPPDQTLTADPGQCSRANVTWALPPVDGCVITGASCTPPSGSTFNVGMTAVNCTIDDGLGGTTTCTFKVTVIDNQPPTLTCPADMLVGTSVTPSLCGAVVNFTPTASDNCPGVSVICNPASGSTFPLGMTTVTCNATDASLNPSAPCSFKVTVVDLSGDANPPCWRGKPGSTHQHWAFANNDDPAAPELVSSPGSPAADVLLGPLSLGWQDVLAGFGCKQGYWDLGANGTITLSVPNIAGPPTAYKYLRLQVTEFRDSLAYNVSPAKSIAGATMISQQETSIELTLTGEWIVHESVWRFATCPDAETIIVTAPPSSALIDQIVVDTFCATPTVCPTDITGDADPGLCVKTGITRALPVADNCVIRSVVCQTNGVIVTQPASFPIGQTAVSCAIADAEGQATICNFLVTISDVEAPVIVSCAPPQSAAADAVNCQAPVPDFTGGVVATDCSALTITQNPLAGTLVGLGSTTVTLTVKDAVNNTATCATTFTVNDATPPVITTCAPPQGADANATCQAAVPDFTGGVVATDCNGPLMITQSPAAGTLVGVGSTTVTLTVKDAANNPATCTTTFTVQSVADLSVQVVSAPEPVTVGQPVSYTVTVANLGPCPASGVIVNSVLSAGQVMVSVTDPGTTTARACPTPDSSAWYRAEGNANDSVGLNNGTINGGVSFGPQAVGQGFSFDGLTGYISAPDAPALRPASLTIEGWIKIGDPNGLHVLLAKPQGSGLADSYSVWVASGVLNVAISDNVGSGPILSYPNVPTTSIFVAADIIDFPSLAGKLKTPPDPVSTYLNGQLSANTLTLLAAYGGGADLPLLRAIVADFNRIIQSGPIYDAMRFAGVTLAPETQYLLARNPTGIDLVRLNRLLIRDAYPTEIQSNLFPELNVRYHIAYTFDSATQKQALYVNGELVDSSFVTKTITYDSRPLVIGAGENAGSADYFYQGELDELGIYSRALSGIEVQGIHNAGADGKCFNSGAVVLGSLASGESQTFTVVAVPTTCPTASLQATVSGTETDPVLANNTATATATVVELPADQLRLSIRRVSINNDHVEISWPITCAPFVLETTDDLSPALIPWTPATVPVQTLRGRYSTVIPASDPHRFFRLKGL